MAGTLLIVLLYAAEIAAPQAAAFPLRGPQARPLALPPPRIEATLDVDSVRVVGRPETWYMEYARMTGLEGTWVILRDPYGGEIRMPSLYFLAVSTDLVAFTEGTQAVSVLYMKRSYYVLVVAVFIVGFLTVITFPFFRYRKRLGEEQARQRQSTILRRHLEEGQEAERLRIARDLHDGPVQDLNALRLRLSMLARDVLDGALNESIEEVQLVIRDLRQISEFLRPPSLGPFGLSAAIRAYAERFQTQYPGIRVQLDLDMDEQRLVEPVRMGLFRIMQESMNNAARHGQPATIVVTLKLRPADVTLTIRDDGSGYVIPDDLEVLGRSRHYGLLGMSERAASIGGTFRIESYPGSGRPTSVCVVAPS